MYSMDLTSLETVPMVVAGSCAMLSPVGMHVCVCACCLCLLLLRMEEYGAVTRDLASYLCFRSTRELVVIMQTIA